MCRLFAERYNDGLRGLVLLDSMPVVPEKPVGRLLGQLLGGDGDYLEAVGLRAACRLTSMEHECGWVWQWCCYGGGRAN